MGRCSSGHDLQERGGAITLQGVRRLGVLLVTGVAFAMPGIAGATAPIPGYAPVEPVEGQAFVTGTPWINFEIQASPGLTGIGSYMRLEIARENVPGQDRTLGDDLLLMPARLMSERDSAPGRYQTGSIMFDYWNQIPATYYFQTYISDQVYGGTPLYVGPVQTFRIEAPSAPTPTPSPIDPSAQQRTRCISLRATRALRTRELRRARRMYSIKRTRTRRGNVAIAKRRLRVVRRAIARDC